MVFSSEFDIPVSQNQDWFDPILSTDTKLFVDPFLIFDSEHPFFEKGHDKIMEFFNHAFEMAAKSSQTKTDLRYRLLIGMMAFPEVEEICLGYSSAGTSGAGSGSVYSSMIVGSIYESIKMGITNFDHFEEIGLFNAGFGSDRISDMTISLLKKEIIQYTQDICREFSVPMKKIRIGQYEFDFQKHRWKDSEEILPINPYTGKAVFLIPQSFLRELPTISAEEFWDYCWSNKNEEIRDQLSIVVKSEINKTDILDIARKNRDWVEEYKKCREENGSVAYDVANDPKNKHKWVYVTQSYVKENPVDFESPRDNKGFESLLYNMMDVFENFVENRQGYKLLWDQNLSRSKNEEASQLLFAGIVSHYCKANNIDLSKEVNLGRGPVDFKFSSGYKNRALLEIKLARNSRFWSGLEKQVVKYLEVEKIKLGFFLVVCYNEKDFAKIKDIQNIAHEVSIRNQIALKVIIIDASKDKPSASKL